jgi:hypothetical protein
MEGKKYDEQKDTTYDTKLDPWVQDTEMMK